MKIDNDTNKKTLCYLTRTHAHMHACKLTHSHTLGGKPSTSTLSTLFSRSHTHTLIYSHTHTLTHLRRISRSMHAPQIISTHICKHSQNTQTHTLGGHPATSTHPETHFCSISIFSHCPLTPSPPPPSSSHSLLSSSLEHSV